MWEATRREFLATLAAAGAAAASPHQPAGPIAIGSRRELFVDDFMIEKLEGASRVLHRPVPREIVLEHDAPWEGTGTGYHSVFYDGQRYRMYYKAMHLEIRNGRLYTGAHPPFTCYAESRDGIAWEKPRLGLVSFQGSKANNIVMSPRQVGNALLDPAHPAVFLDENPDCSKDARFKAVFRSARPKGLLILKSPDGFHWTAVAERPVITAGAFDSQNLAFWDGERGIYRAYWRIFQSHRDPATGRARGYRHIRTAVSRDLVHWEPFQDVEFKDSRIEHMYTNQVKPYYRAPHILIGFPTRYVERGWSPSMRALPDLKQREERAKASLRYGTALTETVLMASRDGVHFERWAEAFLPPGIERTGTWQYGQQYTAWHVVETPSHLPGAPNELSLYSTERYWFGKGTVLRRYTLRLDGFVSVRGPLAGGRLVTRTFTFGGRRLFLNFATGAAGAVFVEIQDPAGTPIRGFSRQDCHPLFGDSVDRPVVWKDGSDVSRLAGKPIRLAFELHDADLYAFRFGN